MKNFKPVIYLLILILVAVGNSCKNAESSSDNINEVKVLEAIKMPVVGGAGIRGVRIMLKINKQIETQIDSIVFDGRSGELSELTMDGVWLESYFYDQNEIIEGKGLVEYKAEGNSCQLFYTTNNKAKSILIPSLELKKDTTLWK